MLHRHAALLTLLVAAIGLGAGGAQAQPAVAPGAPGAVGFWDYAGKSGVGTSYEPYRDGRRIGASKVWFSVADGILTEVMYGLIHQAQIKSARLAVLTPGGLFVEGESGSSTTQYLDTDAQGRPLSLAYRLVTRDAAGTVEIEKHVFTDPSRNVLFMRVIVRPLKGPVTPFLLVEPHLGNNDIGDAGSAGADALTAHKGQDFLTVKASRGFAAASVGFMGVSDGLTELKSASALSPAYATTGAATGSILLAAELSPASAQAQTVDLAFGFGPDAADSAAAAEASLAEGYASVLSHYNGQDGKVGWETYLASLSQLPRLAAQSEDGGRLAYASAMVLKAHEDKTYAGALIASLSNPWGDTVRADHDSTGYKAVWPRDFYQCSIALAALGDRETPVAAFRYLHAVQVRADTPGNHGAVGWFQQKSHVDGAAEWVGVQLDQTAMPIMLGWKLWKLGLISQAEIRDRYPTMIKPAADFLVDGGTVDLGGDHATIKPPFTGQERWEEQSGYSPSTMAAEIAGLTAAADIANLAGDTTGAARDQAAADRYAARIEARTFTTAGALGDGHYYLRIGSAESADQPQVVPGKNGPGDIAAGKMIDAGFLELVRYGVRRADDAHIMAGLKMIDDQTLSPDLRVRYDFHFDGQPAAYPGFRRYGHDGYGEDAVSGANYGANGGAMTPDQRGRVWPLFTGERGHYQLALASLSGPPDPAAVRAIRETYVRGMEHFANAGLMLPEQVYDGVGAPAPHNAPPGQGTDSATPLAWAHAEYIKLLRSLADGQVWDSYEPVKARYAK